MPRSRTAAPVVPLDSFRRHERRLARAQRALARKQKGSSNYRKAKAKDDLRPRENRGRTERLPAQSLGSDQQRPRGRLHRGSERARNVGLGGGHARAARASGSAEVGSEQGHSRPGVGRVPPSAWLQAGLARWAVDRRAAAKYQPYLPRVQARRGGEPAHAGRVLLRRVRLLESRRSGRRVERAGGGRACRIGLWRDGGRCAPCEAGTRRSDSCKEGRMSAVGIIGLQAGEDVNSTRTYMATGSP